MVCVIMDDFVIERLLSIRWWICFWEFVQELSWLIGQCTKKNITVGIVKERITR